MRYLSIFARQLLFLCSFILMTLSSFAQFSKGMLSFGNSASLNVFTSTHESSFRNSQSKRKTFTWQAFPYVGLFIFEDMEVGFQGNVKMRFINNRYSDGINSESLKSQNHAVGGGPFFRYYFHFDRFKLYPLFDAFYGVWLNGTHFQEIKIGLGANYFITKRLALEGKVDTAIIWNGTSFDSGVRLGFAFFPHLQK